MPFVQITQKRLEMTVGYRFRQLEPGVHTARVNGTSCIQTARQAEKDFLQCSTGQGFDCDKRPGRLAVSTTPSADAMVFER